MVRLQIARLFGKLPYFPGQDRVLRALYSPVKVFSGKLPKASLLVEVEGGTFSCDTASFLEWAIAVKGGEEKGLLRFFLNLCKFDTFDQFFDVGSNVGYFAIPISQHINTTCFEPYPPNYKTLEKNINLNVNNDITSFPIALSNDNRKFEIHLANEQCNFGLATIEQSIDSEVSDTQLIDAIVFDEAFSLVDQQLLFKIDVEGHELNVLEGMKNTLKQNHCCIYVETENKKVLQFMKDLGYSVKFMHHNLYREVRLVHSFATGGQGHIIATNFPLILRKQSWVESIIVSLKKFI